MLYTGLKFSIGLFAYISFYEFYDEIRVFIVYVYMKHKTSVNNN